MAAKPLEPAAAALLAAAAAAQVALLPAELETEPSAIADRAQPRWSRARRAQTATASRPPASSTPGPHVHEVGSAELALPSPWEAPRCDAWLAAAAAAAAEAEEDLASLEGSALPQSCSAKDAITALPDDVDMMAQATSTYALASSLPSLK